MMTNTITSKQIAPSELPLGYRPMHHYFELWGVDNAMKLCQMLMERPRVPDITDEEYKNIAIVADGGMWPVPDAVYTQEDWHRSGSFNAVAGQEIEQSIYWHMFEVLPPLSLPRNNPRAQGYAAGFMVSEPVTINPAGPGQLYSAFGKKGGRYYFIGLLPRR